MCLIKSGIDDLRLTGVVGYINHFSLKWMHWNVGSIRTKNKYD